MYNITVEEARAWFELPVTKFVLDIIKQDRDEVGEAILDGKFLADPIENAKMTGFTMGLNRLADIRVDELGGDEPDEDIQE